MKNKSKSLNPFLFFAITLTAVRISIQPGYRKFQAHFFRFVVHKSRAIKFYTVVTNIFRSSVWTLLRITDPVPRILRWFLHFWKIYTSFAIASIIIRIVLFTVSVQGYCVRGQRKSWCSPHFTPSIIS